MRNFSSVLVLGVAGLALVGCGKKEAAVVADADPAPVAADDGVEITIPDAPENPLAEVNAEKAAAYLAENATREGVMVQENGLQIEITEPGTGEPPVLGDIVRFHYTGKFIDGNVFDDSKALGKPLVIPSIDNIPIPGVPEALAMMREGGKATVSVPPALAFGEEGLPGVFEPNTTLIFDLDLVEVVSADEPERRVELEAEQQRLREEAMAEAEAQRAAAEAAMAQAAAENLVASQAYLTEVTAQDHVTTTASGLAYEVVNDGGTGETPDPWDTVEVHYEGTLADGTVFDSSYQRGEPIKFGLNQVIPGWTEGVGLMNVGDTYNLYIPPQLGYGERGTPGGPIGPNQALKFKVELLSIEQGEPPAAE